MDRPWLKDLAEGAGKYAIYFIQKKPKKWLESDAEMAGWCAKIAAHWAHKLGV